MREFYLKYIQPDYKLINSEQAGLLCSTFRGIKKRTALIWSEHCSECAMPSCFSSCEYYSPRMDMKCQRFDNGIVPVRDEHSQLSEVMSINFKKWGKLEAVGRAVLVSRRTLVLLRFINGRLESLVNLLPLPYFFKVKVGRKLKTVSESLAESGQSVSDTMDDVYFLIETLNTKNTSVSFSFTVREVERSQRVFQKKIDIPVGHHKTFVHRQDLVNVSIEEKCFYQIEPSEPNGGLNLVFGVMDFVVLDPQIATENNETKTLSGSHARVKAVVWDLDNTIWDGTLVEDGIDGVKLKPDVASIIVKLDEMGILNSVASKNNSSDAMAALKKFSIEHLFVYPQISWNPKSGSIRNINQSLNIGLDTMVFIDDQEFERTEVSDMLPEVRTYSEEEISDLLNRSEFNIPVSFESKNRRKLYQENQVREQAMESSEDEYTDFLKSCNIQLDINRLDESSLDRVHELSQRTNQMNFTGNRYTKSQLSELINSREKLTFVMSCADRFGEYGVVGFAIIDHPKRSLIDLMFSCRVQAKYVEHAFFWEVLEFYKSANQREFTAYYRQTLKNQQSGKVFKDIGFQKINETEGVQKLVFYLDGFKRPQPFITVIDSVFQTLDD